MIRRVLRALRSSRAPDGASLIPMNSVNVGRFLYFHNLFKMVEDVPGDVVECGVGNGRSLIHLAHSIKLEGSRKHLFGFDSFEGFPEPAPEDQSDRNPQKGDYSVGLGAIQRRLSYFLDDKVFVRSRVTLVKGFFEDTLPGARLNAISLLHLDVDLYESYRTCLEELFDQVSPGGVVTFDEYMREAPSFPGAQKAIDEFFEGKNVRFEKDHYYGKFYAIKE
jgi:O-methyltransferase